MDEGLIDVMFGFAVIISTEVVIYRRSRGYRGQGISCVPLEIASFLRLSKVWLKLEVFSRVVACLLFLPVLMILI